MKATFVIFRFDPAVDKQPRYQEYAIDVEPTDKILDCLNRIRWELDPTLVYRASCSHGICGSDAMVINGHVGLACQKLVRDYKTANNFVIEPLPLFNVIKDLVVDMEPFFAQYRSIKPYLINYDPPPPAERYQSPEDRAVFDDTTKCILCAACTSSCPSFWGNPNCVGPAAIVQAHRFIFDSRDQGSNDRLEVLNDRDGVWRCRTIFNCTGACPREIKVTQAIGEVKKLLLFNRLV